MWNSQSSLPFFQGFSGTTITYDEDLQSWLMISQDKSVNGTATSPIDSMGTGAQKWTFNRDICNRNTLEPLDGSMTVCKRDEFTCNADGHCISMEARCDQFQNCNDFSDEENCKLVVLPENYVKDYPPFTVDNLGNLTKVQVLIKVYSIQSTSYIL